MDGWNDWLRGESPVTVRVAGLLDAGGFTPGPLTCLVEPAADGPGVVVTVLADVVVSFFAATVVVVVVVGGGGGRINEIGARNK